MSWLDIPTAATSEMLCGRSLPGGRHPTGAGSAVLRSAGRRGDHSARQPEGAGEWHVALAGALTLAGAHNFQESSAPLVLMSYYNPIYQLGPRSISVSWRAECRRSRSNRTGSAAGGSPASLCRRTCLRHRGDLPGHSDQSQTSGSRRLPRSAAETGGGFLYCVSLSGVTGARDQLPEHLAEFRRPGALSYRPAAGGRIRRGASAACRRDRPDSRRRGGCQRPHRHRRQVAARGTRS